MDRENTSRTAAGKEGAARQPKAKAPAGKRKTAASAPAVGKTKPAARKTDGATKPAPEKKGQVKTGVKVDVKAEAKAEAREKARKIKLVRDSFTMPESEYAVLGDVKKACLKAGIEVKKSELLRVGVALLRELDAAKIQAMLATLPALKAGRPKKNK